MKVVTKLKRRLFPPIRTIEWSDSFTPGGYGAGDRSYGHLYDARGEAIEVETKRVIPQLPPYHEAEVPNGTYWLVQEYWAWDEFPESVKITEFAVTDDGSRAVSSISVNSSSFAGPEAEAYLKRLPSPLTYQIWYFLFQK